jgi:hypothetical protein
LSQSTCHMITAERYFQIHENRSRADTETALGRIDPGNAIAATAAIEATRIRRAGLLRQMRVDLKAGLQSLVENQWVSWVIVAPAGATRTKDRLETLSGYVTHVDKSSGQVQVKIQCNPQESHELGYEYDKEVTISATAIIQVMKPQPVIEGGPVFTSGSGGGLDYVKA